MPPEGFPEPDWIVYCGVIEMLPAPLAEALNSETIWRPLLCGDSPDVVGY